MAKRKSGGALQVGTRIRVKPGVNAPEFPDVPCGGWTGTIIDQLGKKTEPKFVIEWDAAVVAGMPASYVSQCEEKKLLHTMSCLRPEEIEPEAGGGLRVEG